MDAQIVKFGDECIIEGTEYIVSTINQCTTEVHLREKHGSKMFTVTQDKLEDWIERKNLKFTSRVTESTKIAFQAMALNAEEKLEMIRRVDYTKAVLELEPGSSQKEVENVIQKVCKNRQKKCEENGFPIEKCPGKSSVYRWRKKVIESGYFFAVLAIQEHRNRPRIKRLHPRVEEIIHEVINEYYKVGVKSTVADVIDIIGTRTKEENERLKKGKQKPLKKPAKRTILRRIRAVNTLDLDTARKGVRYAEQNHNYGAKIQFGKFIGSRVEGDTQYVDCLVYDPVLDITYRPELLVFIDCYTRCIVGYELSYLPKSSEKAMRALANMVSASSGPYGCIPCRIVVDNGKEFDNQGLMSISDTLQIIMDFSPPYTPNAKPHVERFFRTLNSKFSHKVPGTTFEHVIARGYYKSEEFAIYRLDELHELVKQTIEAYHCTAHSALVCSPDTAWRLAREGMSPPLLNRDTLLAMGSRVVSRKVNKGRVTVANLQWHSPALQELGEAVKSRGGEVQVGYCPADLTYAYAWDPQDPTNIIICEPVDPELQTGLTLEMHEAIRRNLNTIEQASGNPERALQLRTSLTIRLLEEAKQSANKTKKKRAQMAEAALRELEHQTNQLRIAEDDVDFDYDGIHITEHDDDSNTANHDFQLI